MRIGLIGVLAVVGCGASGDDAVKIVPEWPGVIGTTSARNLGHNAVWNRGGLGLWDETKHGPAEAVMAKVQALRPGVLRFPGGTRAMRYHFAETVGPRAGRKPQCDTFKGVLDATGYGLDEFMTVANATGAEVTLVSPWVDGTPEETAAFVAYANAPVGSTVAIGVDANGTDWGTAGSWAQRRAQNGHAEPYGVAFLEIGNEPYLSLPVGPSTDSCGRPGQFKQSERYENGVAIPTTAADHAAQVARTGALVRAVDPAILIGASGASAYDGTADAATARGDVDRVAGREGGWNARLLADAGGAFDFFVLHPYDFTVNDEERLLLAERLRTTARDLATLAPEKQRAVTEFGFLFGGSTLLNAIVTADMVRVAVEEQLLMTLRHLLIEDDPTGPFADSAAILGANHTETVGYSTMLRLRETLEAVAVPVKSGHAEVTVLATRDAQARALGVVIIDRRSLPTPALTVALALPPGTFAGTAHVLSGPTLASKAQETTFEARPLAVSGTLRLALPPNGIAFVQLDTR